MNAKHTELAHEHAIEALAADRGGDLDATAALWRTREMYRSSYDLACMAMTWCGVRRIIFTNAREAVSAFQAANTVVHA